MSNAADTSDLKAKLASWISNPAAPFGFAFREAEELFGGRLNTTINPRTIMRQFISVREVAGIRYRVAEFFIGSGEWNRHLKRVTNIEIFAQVRELLEAGRNFRGLPSYQRMVGRMQIGNADRRPAVDLDTIEKIDDHFERTVALIESIRKNGVWPRKIGSFADVDLGHLSPSRTAFCEAVERDVGVALDANGAPVRLCSGQHRFCIAHLLGVQHLPVQIRMIHASWLKRFSETRSLSCDEAVVAVVEEAGRRLSQPPQFSPRRHQPGRRPAASQQFPVRVARG